MPYGSSPGQLLAGTSSGLPRRVVFLVPDPLRATYLRRLVTRQPGDQQLFTVGMLDHVVDVLLAT
ncbi:hypothetical protein ACGFX4_35185 [Kitasatospora sp. NPDC048365]|uniref:hypothetical protein n=1 Tax=Kitasatospora sp. NPDC048365 TaxID=3364050 RepID=UPI00371CA1BD